MTTTGTTVPATVTCPNWCEVTQQEHNADLWNLEMHCVHWNRSRSGTGWYVDHGLTTLANGTRVDEPLLHLDTSNEMTLRDAEEYARAILEAVEEARA